MSPRNALDAFLMASPTMGGSKGLRAFPRRSAGLTVVQGASGRDDVSERQTPEGLRVDALSNERVLGAPASAKDLIQVIAAVSPQVTFSESPVEPRCRLCPYRGPPGPPVPGRLTGPARRISTRL